MTWLDKKEELRRLIIEEKKSYQEIGRMYGVSGTYIKKVAKRFNIPVEPRRAINPNETFKKEQPKRVYA
jgi:hypothetical protein